MFEPLLGYSIRNNLDGCRCVVLGVLILALNRVGPLVWQQLLLLLHALVSGLLGGFIPCGTWLLMAFYSAELPFLRHVAALIAARVASHT